MLRARQVVVTRYLITWKVVNARIPTDPQERIKRAMAFAQFIQENMKSGKLKDWGGTPDTAKGYGVYEGTEIDMAIDAARFGPDIEWEVTPILTLEQYLDLLKKASEMMPAQH